MSEPRDPFDEPPGWTDPYGDLNDLTGDEPIPPLEDPSTPAATPPGSPLLTGLVVALLLVAISVAVFQLLRDSGEGDGGEAAETTTTTDQGSTTTSSSTTTTTTIPLPPNDPYPAVGPQIPVGQMKLMTDRVRVQDDQIPDIAFGDPATQAIGSLTASFGDPDQDNGWQVSQGDWGVCVGEFERIVRYGPFAAIVTMQGETAIFNGYRQDVQFGDLGSPSSQLETLSGLRAGDTVADLESTYADLTIEYSEDPTHGTVFQITGDDGSLILWGPVGGQESTDPVLGIYAPNICDR
jgi:hypothetical protein